MIEFYDGEAIEEVDIKLLNFSETALKLNRGESVIQVVIDKLRKL